MTGLLLVVDLDGTLYRGDAPVRRYAALIAATLPPASAQAYLAALERYLASGPAAAAGSADAAEAAALREAVDAWGAAALLAARCHGVRAETTHAAFLASREWIATPECSVELVTPLVQALAELRAAATITLVTNSPDLALAGFLAKLGVAGCFDQIVAGAGKPDGLRRLLRCHLGADPAEPWRVFSIGDHYRNDIAPAVGIGAAAGYIDRFGRADGPATATAATAEGLLPALRAWAADPQTTARGGASISGLPGILGRRRGHRLEQAADR